MGHAGGCTTVKCIVRAASAYQRRKMTKGTVPAVWDWKAMTLLFTGLCIPYTKCACLQMLIGSQHIVQP